MFTGIVQVRGEVARVQQQPDSAQISVRGPGLHVSAIGDSVAVDGVCLTVVSRDGDTVVCDVMQETLRRTTLAAARAGDKVNLELAATPTSRLGGHLVQGHVDGVGRIVARQPTEHWELVSVDAPADLVRYIVEKGSIALDGVSLTVVSIDANVFTVSLIPETLRRTSLGTKGVGDDVNIEVDVIAKYVERLLAARLET
jgi:riboflavin synthase